MTVAREIDVRNTVGKFEFAVASETIEDEGEVFVTFNVAWPLEEFVQDSADQILRGGDKARHRDLVGQFAINEPLVVCEVDVDLHVERRARGRGSACGGWGEGRREGGCNRRCL